MYAARAIAIFWILLLFTACRRNANSCFIISNPSPAFGEKITLDASCSHAKWVEFFVDGTFIGGGNTAVTYVCDQMGDHTITAKVYSKRVSSTNSRNGCIACFGSGKTSESFKSLHVSSEVSITANSTTLYCDETLMLSVGIVPGASYNWQGPSGFNANSAQVSIPHITGDAAGTYSVFAELNGKSSSVATIQVNVLPVPTPCSLTPNQVDVQNFGQGSFSTVYNWVDNDSYTITGNNVSLSAQASFYSAGAPLFGIYQVNSGSALARNEVRLKIQFPGTSGQFNVDSGKVYVSTVNGKLSATFCNVYLSNSFGNYIASGNLTLP